MLNRDAGGQFFLVILLDQAQAADRADLNVSLVPDAVPVEITLILSFHIAGEVGIEAIGQRHAANRAADVRKVASTSAVLGEINPDEFQADRGAEDLGAVVRHGER